MGKNEKLKMKFKLNGLEFELEGKEETVISEFKKFKSFVTEDLSSLLSTPQIIRKDVEKNLPSGSDSEDEEITESVEVENSFERPVLKQVVMKDLPNSEAEWLLIYACYASDFGNDTFTADDIKEKYQESGRSNQSRINNLSNNFKTLISKDYIKVHNATEYILKAEGLEYAKSIFKGKLKKKKSSSKKSPTSTTAKKTAKKSSESYKIDPHLDLRGDTDTISLKKFFEQKKPSSLTEFNALIVYYMQELLKKTNITLDQAYTCYKELDKKPADHFKQSFRDTKTKKGYIEFDENWILSVPHRGKSFIEHDLPKAKK